MKALVAYKRSKYDLYSHSPDASVRAYADGDSDQAKSIRESHAAHTRSYDRCIAVLERLGIEYTTVWRADIDCVKDHDLVISIGGDGTFLDVAHYTDKTPILGVNSDPLRSKGIFCTATADTLEETLRSLDAVPRTTLYRLELSIDGRALPTPALNEVMFSHSNPSATSCYDLIVDGERRSYRSSGAIISSAAGSTAWIWQDNGIVMPLDSRLLQYHHRDKRTAVPALASSMSLVSHTREGRIYIDGESLDYELGLGQRLDVKYGAPLTSIGDISKNREGY